MSSIVDKTKYYARMQIETSTKPRLVCMLHDRCVQLIRQSMEDKQINNLLLVNAQNILAQLERSLKRTDDVSEGLFYLYDFCYCNLEKADTQSLETALEIMTGLRDTFDLLVKR